MKISRTALILTLILVMVFLAGFSGCSKIVGNKSGDAKIYVTPIDKPPAEEPETPVEEEIEDKPEVVDEEAAEEEETEDVEEIAEEEEEPEELEEEPEEIEDVEYSETQRIQPSDLRYMGSFRLPDWAGSDERSWNWGGTALTYYPGGDPANTDAYPGSLFGAGHNHHQYISEINIPAPINSRNLNDLNKATTLQQFTDIKGDMFGYLEIPRVGLAYLPAQTGQTEDKIYFTWGQHMQEGDGGPSHGWFSLDLSRPNIAGPWRIEGQTKYTTTDYMFEIPESFANEFLGGKRLATGRFRDGGQGWQGPDLIAIAPWQQGTPPPLGSTLSSTSLLQYRAVYDDEMGEHALENYHHSDAWSGGAWLTKGDNAAVIFIGMKGQGDNWYGFQDGTAWYRPGEEWRYDLEGEGERGWWSDSWEATVLFYDPQDFAHVVRGEMESWQPQPYASLNIHDVLFNPATREIRELGSVAYDRDNNMLYVMEYLGDIDEGLPLVHVWKIN